MYLDYLNRSLPISINSATFSFPDSFPDWFPSLPFLLSRLMVSGRRARMVEERERERRARKQCYGTRSFRPELVTHTSLWLECSHRIIPGSAADIVKYCWSDLTCHHGGCRWSPVRVLVHGLLAGVVARLRERARQRIRISGVFTWVGISHF